MPRPKGDGIGSVDEGAREQRFAFVGRGPKRFALAASPFAAVAPGLREEMLAGF